MPLPITPPLLPQLAKSRTALPEGEGWVYEPKWDGFRALAFVDGNEVYLQSRNGRPLTRYFPELAFPDGRYVLDGEIDGVGALDRPLDITRSSDGVLRMHGVSIFTPDKRPLLRIGDSGTNRRTNRPAAAARATDTTNTLW